MKRSKPLAVVAALLLLTAAVQPAAAQSDSEDESVVTIVMDAAMAPIDFATGLAARTGMAADARFGDEPNASTQLESLRAYIDGNSSRFADHATLVAEEYNRSVGDGTYTYALSAEDSAATIYIVAEADGENVTSISAVNETSASVDQSFELSAVELEALNEDLRDYDENYVSESRVPDRGYYISHATKYGGL